MIVYLDSSALVKRYVAEAGSEAVNQLIGQADVVGTSLISRVEVTAALAKAVRVGLLQRDEAGSALQTFTAEWNDVLRLQLTETVAARAGDLAWGHGLRAYDAVHLAVALFWHETVGEAVTLATFDRQLWDSGSQTALSVWPTDLEPYTRP